MNGPYSYKCIIILLANPNLVASTVPVKYIHNAGRLSITLRLKVISQTYTYVQRRPSNSIQCKRNKINEMDWIVLALLIHSNNRPPALEVRLELVSLHGVATFWLFYMHICQITNWYFTKQAETVASSFRSIDIQANFGTTKFWTYRF